MRKNTWRDFSIIFSSIWINVILFAVVLTISAVLLRFYGTDPQASWAQLFLDALNLATMERVETGGKLIPTLIAFISPILMLVIVSEGIMRVFSTYLQRRVNRKEWDLMVAKTFKDHTVVCGVGEMGRQLLHKMRREQPDMDLILIDPHPGLLAELGYGDDHILQFQGDMTDMETLMQANIQTAKMAVLTAGEDAINLETAYKIQQVNPEVVLWVRLHHSGLAELLDLSRKTNIHFFCPYQQAADAIISHMLEHP